MAPSKLDTNVLFDDSSDEESPSQHQPELEIEIIPEEERKFNDKEPTLQQRVHLYLKPTDYNHCLLIAIMLIETSMAWVFVYFQVDYVLTWPFESLTDKAMQIMIGFGIVGVVTCYTILDAIRFLPSYLDKALYILSSLMLKPILLPVILPGSLFRSPIAVRRQGKYVHQYNGFTETRFMMAVEETNFLMTFTLAGVSAMSTFFAVAQSGSAEQLPIDTLFVSLAYGMFGLTVAIWMYGRKVQHHQYQSKI